MRKPLLQYALAVIVLLFSFHAKSQSPGIIVRPAGGPYSTVLNPAQNGYSSTSTAGFKTDDIAESEIKYKVVPPAVTEPTGDLATGPSGGFTDIVKTIDGSGFYVFSNGTNIYFRLRIGGIISGSKGYSVLIDTDGRMGNSGPSADPNYVAPTNTSNGNPGFEYEVVFQSNFQVAVYTIDGITNPGTPVTYSLNTNSQISVAASTDGNTPDYFYDWFVPLSAIGNPASIRMAATTVTSPNSALQGSRSDIYGIDDRNTTVANAWASVVNAQPPVSITGSGISAVGAVCTAPPVVTSPIGIGANVNVSGTWTRMDASKPSSATITLYRNGIALTPTVTVSSGGTWSITVAAVASGDVFYARAVATGESMCLQSNNVTAGCITPINPSVLTQSSSKGICGSMTTGATAALIYLVDGSTTTLVNSGNTNMAYTATTFTWFACSGGSGNLANGTYMIVLTGNGCTSAPVFTCIANGNGTVAGLSAVGISLTTPIYPYQTSISGAGATSGSTLRLAVNDVFVSSITATGSTFTFTGLSLKANDQLKVYQQPATGCMSVSSTTTVSCFTEPPLMTTNGGSLLAGATAITGTSSASGATVNVFRGTAPSGVSIGTATVNSSGVWSLNTTALVAGENYYATQTVSGCTSPASAAASVAAVTTVCPTLGSSNYASNVGTITGAISTTFAGVVKLYLDGTLIGTSATLTNPNTGSWSIPVNTNYSNILYAGGVLTTNTQATGAAEKTNCGISATITCTSPLTPAISPSATTIYVGQSVTYSINTVDNSSWYSIMDNTGKAYATSVYKTDNNNFSMTTNSFTTAGVYDLKLSADKLTGCAASFATAKITVNHVVLPARFIAVSVEKFNNQPRLEWRVTDEQNVNYYSVERSYDCSFFEEAGKVGYKEAAGTFNDYIFRDKELTEGGNICYRIKQVDNNGKYHYSKIVSLKVDKVSAMQVAPNPAYDKTTIKLNAEQQQNGMLQLVDLSGVIIHQQKIQLKKGTNTIVLANLQHFARGHYFIKAVLAEGTIHKKILLQ